MAVSSIKNAYFSQIPQFRAPATNGSPEASPEEPFLIKPRTTCKDISNILKEESYLDIVIDPLGGSYSIEILTEEIARKGWEKFQDIEGINNGVRSKLFINKVKEKANIRINKFKNNSIKLIGINAFKNPKEIKNKWKEIDSYLGLPTIILETV